MVYVKSTGGGMSPALPYPVAVDRPHPI